MKSLLIFKHAHTHTQIHTHTHTHTHYALSISLSNTHCRVLAQLCPPTKITVCFSSAFTVNPRGYRPRNFFRLFNTEPLSQYTKPYSIFLKVKVREGTSGYTRRPPKRTPFLMRERSNSPFPRSRQSPCTEGVWQLGRDILEKTAELDFVQPIKGGVSVRRGERTHSIKRLRSEVLY